MRRAAILALVLAGCTHTSPPAEPPLPENRIALALEDLSGNVITLGSLRGRVVLLSVIATWADPALVEIPRFKALFAAYPRDQLAIVSVVLDDQRQMVRIFAKTFEIPYTIAVTPDPAELTSERGPLGSISIIPTSFLIDQEGRIAARMEGTWPDEVLEKAVAQLVAGSIGTH